MNVSAVAGSRPIRQNSERDIICKGTCSPSQCAVDLKHQGENNISIHLILRFTREENRERENETRWVREHSPIKVVPKEPHIEDEQ